MGTPSRAMTTSSPCSACAKSCERRVFASWTFTWSFMQGNLPDQTRLVFERELDDDTRWQALPAVRGARVGDGRVLDLIGLVICK